MSDSDRPKPLPARPPSSPLPNGPTPAPAAAPSELLRAPNSRVGEPPEEVDVTWRDAVWKARVLGRTGRAEARSAPLMLVGFREAGSAEGSPCLETMVPGRRLADLPEEALQAALERAKAPPASGERRPFFEDSDPTRRSRPESEY